MSYTPLEMVRLNLTDLDPDKQIFTDDQLQAWIEKYDGSASRATWKALRTIALNELLLSKVIRTQDLSTDGRAVADSLLRLAQTYLDEAKEEESEAEGGGLTFISFGGGKRRRETEEYKLW